MLNRLVLCVYVLFALISSSVYYYVQSKPRLSHNKDDVEFIDEIVIMGDVEAIGTSQKEKTMVFDSDTIKENDN